jgi:hypothetical protein
MTKFFAVRKYGGVRKALAQARAAEAELKKLAPPTTPRKGARVVAQTNNTSGVIGIRPRFVLFSDHPYLYFVASWSVNGKPRSTSYSAERHGKLDALGMAMEQVDSRQLPLGGLGSTSRNRCNAVVRLRGLSIGGGVNR